MASGDYLYHLCRKTTIGVTIYGHLKHVNLYVGRLITVVL